MLEAVAQPAYNRVPARKSDIRRGMDGLPERVAAQSKMGFVHRALHFGENVRHAVATIIILILILILILIGLAL